MFYYQTICIRSETKILYDIVLLDIVSKGLFVIVLSAESYVQKENYTIDIVRFFFVECIFIFSTI